MKNYTIKIQFYFIILGPPRQIERVWAMLPASLFLRPCLCRLPSHQLTQHHGFNLWPHLSFLESANLPNVTTDEQFTCIMTEIQDRRRNTMFYYDWRKVTQQSTIPLHQEDRGIAVENLFSTSTLHHQNLLFDGHTATSYHVATYGRIHLVFSERRLNITTTAKQR